MVVSKEQCFFFSQDFENLKVTQLLKGLNVSFSQPELELLSSNS